MANDAKDDAALEALFAEARRVEPSPDLTARVVADGLAAQASMGAMAPSRSPAPRARGWRQWLDAVGGWQGATGITAAGLVGLWVGFSAPDLVEGMLGAETWSVVSSDYGATPAFADLWLEDDDV